MKVKTQRNIIIQTPEWLKWEKPEISVDKDIEKLKPSSNTKLAASTKILKSNISITYGLEFPSTQQE